ncbi:hypothetical protein AA12717_2036 [Gluconacetobacter sacchari DSM 12717]|uniref:DUF4880 domain-containing protein n=2 Tax=Gluconacetobacter sacchari TaxID=92759 RepID=A0A7W4ICG7_9PROT|nr:DUF4880 domain-containing protein [Gluconacetobacter sacchari]MBB2160338.1 DUF4880 domain-containing protein [Gluconacetobacter sacchari]GBQ25353.1 hypothetical protein AA12717_2036 [Gluconacetobacter sacchari DSM 12717]
MATLHETAAYWFARLHAPDFSEQDRQRFTAWYNETPAQAQAYELISAIWQASEIATSQSGRTVAVSPALLTRRGVLAGVSALMLGAFAVLPDPAEATIRATRTGQQMTFAASPSMTVLLDSDSSVAVHGRPRTLALLYGQIQVNCRGDDTRNGIDLEQWHACLPSGSFNMFRSPLKNTLTVLSGTAVLSRAGMASPCGLRAGERATILPDGRLSIDHPLIDDVMAWRSGRLAFRNTPLSEAVEEMNRYSTTKILVQDSAANLRISGFYHFGQNAAFARLLENVLPVRATFGKEITIVKL